MMNTKPGSCLRVIADYQAPFPDPIQVAVGEPVAIDIKKKTRIAGWIWCTNHAGKSGWVPKAYVHHQGATGTMKCDYDAIELTIHIGDLLTVHKEESGFYWVTSSDGRQGWVPVEHVEPDQFGKEREAE